jgi:hypothetical protein
LAHASLYRDLLVTFVICTGHARPLPRLYPIEKQNRPANFGGPTMSQDKAASKRKRRKAVPMLGAAGLSLTLASGASAATAQPTADMAARRAPAAQEITLAEEEISGVSLATFHVFDKENAAKPQRGPRFAMAAGGCAGCAGCGGCGCWTGTYYTSPVIGNGGYDPPPRVVKPRKYTGPSKRAPGQ